MTRRDGVSELDLAECPRGHSHPESAAFCTVCGAGPVLPPRTVLAAPWLDAWGDPGYWGWDDEEEIQSIHIYGDNGAILVVRYDSPEQRDELMAFARLFVALGRRRRD